MNESKCSNDIKLEKYTALKKSLDSITLQENWRKLKCGLWINKNNEIGLKDYQTIGANGIVSREYFLTSFGYNRDKPLNKTIDTTTFRELGNTFYKDKNHIYHFYAMAGGGNFYIFEEADYQTFEILSDCYAKDKNHIYEMRSGIIENVDYKSFVTKKNIEGCIAKDKNGFLIWGDRINVNEIEDEVLKKEIREFDKN